MKSPAPEYHSQKIGSCWRRGIAIRRARECTGGQWSIQASSPASNLPGRRVNPAIHRIHWGCGCACPQRSPFQRAPETTPPVVLQNVANGPLPRKCARPEANSANGRWMCRHKPLKNGVLACFHVTGAEKIATFLWLFFGRPTAAAHFLKFSPLFRPQAASEDESGRRIANPRRLPLTLDPSKPSSPPP